MIMLVLEGILINVFETPKGVTKDGKEYAANQNSGHVRKHVSKRRKTYRDGDFDCFRYLTLPWQENAPVRSCGFKRVSGKGVFKGNDLSAFWGCRADEAHPKWRKSAVFLALISWYMDLKRLSLLGGLEGVAVLKTGKIWMNDGKKKPVFWQFGDRRKRTRIWEPQSKVTALRWR